MITFMRQISLGQPEGRRMNQCGRRVHRSWRNELKWPGHRGVRTLSTFVLLGLMIFPSYAFRYDEEEAPLTDQKVEPPRALSADQMRAAEMGGKLGVHVVWHSRLGTPRSIRAENLGQRQAFSGGKGLLVKGSGAYQADAIAVLDNLAPFFRIRDAQEEFAVRKVEPDALGFHHARVNQMYQGLRVVGGELIVHFNKKDLTYEVNGQYVPDIHIDVVSRMTAAEATRIAQEDLIGLGKPQGNLTKEPELVVFARGVEPQLAYELTLSYDDPKAGPGRWRYWMDGLLQGKILLRYNDIQKIAPPTTNGTNALITGGILTGEGGSSTNVIGWHENTGYDYLYNNLLNWYVYNVAYSSYPDANTYAYRGSNSWGSTDRAEISLGSGFDWVQRHWLNVHGRHSFDNARAYARANAHEGVNYVNAYWDGMDFHFGDGDGVEANSLAVLDVAGHEFAHAVTEYSANLVYAYEPGALNESFSDIFGACVESYSQPDGRAAYPTNPPGTADWLCGEDCWLSSIALRDLRNPANTATVGAGNEQPSRYHGTYWYDGLGDNGGVHQNSGVQNYFFYLLSEGGSGNNDGIVYQLTGIGMTNAAQIAYRALTVYCTPNTDYRAARSAWTSAAADLDTNWVRRVEQAWSAVGIGALTIAPDHSVTFRGPVGGPFTPTSQSFTVSNNGARAMSWTAWPSQGWTDLSATGGILGPYAQTNITIRINSTANSLSMGAYTNWITFSNTVESVLLAQPVTLRVGAIDYFTELFDTSANDLSYKTLTFRPDGSAGFYAAYCDPATSFPTDPTGGITFSLSDDSFAQITLSGGHQVSLYGMVRNTLFVGSNGYLTFDSGDTRFGESFASHFNRPRISGLFDDLYSSTNVSWKEFPDRVAVTFQNVQELGASNTNSFQFELFYDGTIRMTFLQIAARDGLAGLSQGLGTPADFLASDLSTYPAAPPPDALTVTPRSGMSSIGYPGGPFTPSNHVYTLANVGESNLTWLASCSSNWVSIMPSGGMLAAGQTTQVSVAINANASGLEVGVYGATVAFSNAASGVAQTRAVHLTVKGEIAFYSASYIVGEASGTAWITVQRAGNTNRAVTVDFATSDGTAIAGSDYVMTTGTLVFAMGQLTNSFVVPILNDWLTEGSESVNLTLSNPTGGGTLGKPRAATLTILDDDGFFDDFEPNIDLPQWSAFGGTVGSTVLATNYGGFVSSPNSLWFGDASDRLASTRTLNTSSGGPLSFWLRFGYGWSNTWETVDLPAEGVVVEYSADGGTNWTTFGRYNTTNFYSWTHVSMPIPVAAQGPAMRFRWRQLSNSGIEFDHWALDNVLISTMPPDDLKVTPWGRWASLGRLGGPFSPSNAVYTLSNIGTGTGSLVWTATARQDWLTITPSSGTLGRSTEVTVAINSQATTLPEGIYTNVVTFSNVTTSVTQTREVTLTVFTSPQLTLTPPSFTVTNVLGRRTQRALTVGNAAGADGSLTFRLSTREGGSGSAPFAGLGVELPPAGHDFTKVAAGVEFREERLLVRFAEGMRGAARAGLLARLGGATVEREYQIVPGLCLVKLPQGASVAQALVSFNGAAGVVYAEPDYQVKALGIPNDVRFSELWGMHNTGQAGGRVAADIDAPEAWNTQTGNRETVVAVIDTGVDYNHEDLSANMWRNPGEIPGNGLDDDGNNYVDDVYGINAIMLTGDPMDDHDHGTHCAGTIGGLGNNSVGVAGVCWQVRIMALKFLDTYGGGLGSDAITCIEYAVAKRAKVLSNSWGGDGYQQALKDAIDAAGAAGITFVAAAGNSGMDTDVSPNYPSCYTSANVIAVMATDNNDTMAWFSNYGRQTVDLGAPGVNILSCQRDGGYQTMSGTSMATPHVAGACGLLLSQNPLLSVTELKNALLNTVDVPATPLTCVSSGRLNLARAVMVVEAQWLTVNPRGATNLPPGSATTITVDFHAGDLGAGTYTGEIVVASNDRLTPLTNVSARMVVLRDNLQVTPAEGLVATGMRGGPFTLASKVYTLTNVGTGTGMVYWSATSTQSWITVSSSSGTLWAGASAVVTVALNNAANVLPAGGWGDVLVFSNRASGAVFRRMISLEVKPSVVADDLQISPATGLKVVGRIGGPFLSNKVYRLVNAGFNTLTWTATAGGTQSWVSVSSPNGVLESGAITNVTVSINEQANMLPDGVYTDAVIFYNVTNAGTGQTRSVQLTIKAPPPEPFGPIPTNRAVWVPADTDLSWNNTGAVFRAAQESLMTVQSAVRSIIERSGILNGPIVAVSEGRDQDKGGGESVVRYTKPEEIAIVRFATDVGVEPSSALNVAICAADEPIYLTDVQSKLLRSGRFNSVTVINVRTITPTLAEMQAFDAVQVHRNWDYANPTAMGNVLADYVDAGGGVVCMIFEIGSYSTKLGGRWETGGYVLMDRTGNMMGQDHLGNVHFPSHPIMMGVTSFDGGSSSYKPATTVVYPGVTLVAEWASGHPLVSTRETNGTCRADITFYPISSDALSDGWVSSTDGSALMANALAWVAGEGGSQDSYDIYFGTSSPPTNRITQGIRTTHCNAGLLNFNTTYYWQVVASNDVGMTTGPVWSFTTASDMIQCGLTTYSVAENGGSATITVTRANGSLDGVSVDFATSDGTAIAGSDYVMTTGTLVFAMGQLTNRFVVPILNDWLTEESESVNLTLSNPTGGGTLGKPRAATLTISDDDGFFDDFEPNIDLPQWSAFGGTVGSTVLATNYGGFVSSPNSLWFGDASDRFASTRTLNTSSGGPLSFWLRFGNGWSNTWETVDLPAEGVVVEYSADGGTNWTTFGRYNTTNFYSWTHVSMPIPVSAQGPAMRFRWRQLSNSGIEFDHWALDNVLISTMPPDDLKVTPWGRWASLGRLGGPFSPSNAVYTLSNIGTGTGSLVWTATARQDWLTITPSSGTLGRSTEVTVAINSRATTLPEGIYTNVVTFSNVTTSVTQTREVTLTVFTSPQLTLTPPSFTVTNVLGGRTQRALTVGNAAGADGSLTFRLSTREGGSGSAPFAGLGVELPPAGHDFTKVAAGVEFREERLLVRFAEGMRGAARAGLLARLGGATVEREYQIVPGLCLVKLPQGASVAQALVSFNGAAGVVYAEPDYQVKALGIPNDVRFSELWGMHNTGQAGGRVAADIDAPEAWNTQTGNRETVVAVIDTGVDYNHEDLSANMWRNPGEIPGNGLDDDGNNYVDDVYGINAIMLTGDPMDDHDHGTHCAGTIGGLGNNSVGVAGVCWQVRIMALKFLDTYGGGLGSDAITCIEYAVAKRAKVLSNSWGGDGYQQALKDAIDAAGAAGITFVAAAGNSGMDTDVSPNYPSCYTSANVIAVMATDNNDAKAFFSNYGRQTVDLGAPGVNILSCQRDGGYQTMSGTSMATPHVAGACGLLLSQNPLLSVTELKNALLNTVDVPATPLTCVSSGRLNLARAVMAVEAQWLTVNPRGATNLPPGSATTLTVDFHAGDLGAGTYTGEIVVASNDRLTPLTNVSARMVVLRDNLQVTPAEGLVATGMRGGPFTPASKVYTLTNVGTGTEMVYWSATSTQSWITVSSSSGTLWAGASAVVTVRISSAANWLHVGAYGDRLTFSNRHSGASQSRRVSLDVAPIVIYSFPLDTNPNWRVEGQWAFGQPQGLGGDPRTGHTGSHVYGYNLAGSYTNNIPAYYLTMGPLDCSRYEKIGVRFWKWLGVESASFDHANVQVSANGAYWTTVWEHTGGSFQDMSWQEMVFDISAVADEQPTVYLRWGMGSTDRSVVYSGWNIDDIAITGDEIESLRVSPERGLNSGGHPGGPFIPSNAVYTVSNVGTGRIAWTARSAQNWMTMTLSNGTLEAGASAAVTVTLNGQASALLTGIYTNLLIFSNATTTLTQTRPVILTVFTSAPTLYVDAGNTNGIEDGTVAHPYRTIGRAVDATSAGSTIQVAAGTDNEQVRLCGKYGITLVGAGASTFVTNTGYKFRLDSSSEITIEGFHLIGGTNGIHIVNSSGIALISNLIENVSQHIYGYGGAVSGSVSSIRMSGNTIQNCYGGQMGGAGYFVNCSLDIRDNSFLNDTAWNSAGGIYVGSDRPGNSVKLYRNLFDHCQADFSGAIDIRGSQIDQIEIFNNRLTRCGTVLDFFNKTGTIRLDIRTATSTVQVVNNILCDPMMGPNAQRVGVYVNGAAPVYVANNIFSGPAYYSVYGESGSRVTAEYNCNNGSSYSGVTVGLGAIRRNPRFINANEGDFRLLTGSPCINTGNPAALYNDLDGTRNDMGVFGGPWSGITNGGVIPITTNTIYVNAANAGGVEDGTLEHPYRTISKGVAASTAGSIIRVASGVYAEQVSLLDKNYLTLLGSGAGTVVTNAGYKFRVEYSSEITIQGFNVVGNGSGIMVNSSDEITIRNLNVIRGGSGISVNSSDEITIQDIHVIGGSRGIEIVNSAHVALMNNLIEDVSQGAFSSGGAVVGSDSSLHMSGNTIQNCYGGQVGGAGLFVNCSLEISDNRFLNNRAWHWAGGIYVRSDRTGNSVKLYRNFFSDCVANYSGAIDIRGSQIDRIEIFNNRLTRCGAVLDFFNKTGTIRLDIHTATSMVQVVNNILCDPTIGPHAQRVGIYVNGAAPVYVANNIFSGPAYYSVYGESGSQVTAEYNCDSGGSGYRNVMGRAGTITNYPRFLNPDTGDFRLLTNSPCINTGNPAASYNDLDGSRNNMGIFGGPWSGVTNGGVVPITTNTIYVNGGATNGLEDGTAAHPYRTIGQGVTNAAAGSTVQVAAGVYAEQVSLCDKCNIALIGANASTIVTNTRSKFWIISSVEMTIQGFHLIGGSNGVHLVNSSGVALMSNVIEGVSRGAYGYGGAVSGSGSSLRMSGNTIQNCYGGQMGGAGYFVNCSLDIRDNSFLDDTAWNSAGGIYVGSDRPGNSVKLYRNLFDHCQADFSGAIDIRGSQIDQIEIFNNILMSCGTDYSWAGAIRLGVSNATSTAQIVNNVIHGFTTGWDAPAVGVYVKGAAPVYVANNIFSGTNGYSVYGASGNHVTAEYNCNNGNGYSGVTVGPGTITDNPMFVNPNAGNFHLQTNSACIDAGNPAASYNDTDGSRNDMGAYGGLSSTRREVRVVNATGAAGGTVIVPIHLAALGDENGVSFSVTYDSMALSNPQVTLGTNASHATLMVNTQQTGQVGVVLNLNAGQTFTEGDMNLVRIEFAIATDAPMGATSITFTNMPLRRREVSDNLGNSLLARWLNGAVEITWGYEADVAPRPNGNGRVMAEDVTRVGRFVAGLDLPTAAEFMRADCADRVDGRGTLILGNGNLGAGDVRQAARYAVGLDPLTPVGGPVGMSMNVLAPRNLDRIQDRNLSDGECVVRIENIGGVVGGTVMAPIKLVTTGDVNSLNFSMTYDPMRLSNPQVALGADATSASMEINTQQVGQVGVMLWLSSDQMFPAGDMNLVRVTFSISTSAPAEDTPIRFTDMPAFRSVSGANAVPLSATWIDGLVNVIGNGDSDGDGMSDGAEIIAGTDIDDSNSCFNISILVSNLYALSGNEVILQWFSASNRVYHLYRSTNLNMINNGFHPLPPTNIQATPTLNTYTDTTATTMDPYFYKVGVEMRGGN